MPYVILPNLQVVFFFCPVIESFKKIFICRLTMGSIVVYYTTIIPNTLDKVFHYIELGVIKGWLR